MPSTADWRSRSRADLLERRSVGPDSPATRALGEVGAPDDHRLHLRAAAGAGGRGGPALVAAIRPGAAMRTELRADKDRGEAGRAGHRRERRPAVVAAGRLGGGRRPAHRALQCFGRHGRHQVLCSALAGSAVAAAARGLRLYFARVARRRARGVKRKASNMGLIDYLKTQFLEIIQWQDDSRDTISFRFPDEDKEIKRGAQLIVRESQVAQFVYLGQFGDTFGPGTLRSPPTTSPSSPRSRAGSTASNRRSRPTSISSTPACSPATSGARPTRS